MSFETAKNVINWIFTHVPDYADGVEINFIGGEPLLEYPLIKEIFSYVSRKQPKIPYIFFATTNGTLLSLIKIFLIFDVLSYLLFVQPYRTHTISPGPEILICKPFRYLQNFPVYPYRAFPF
jgi:hypothetical protein